MHRIQMQTCRSLSAGKIRIALNDRRVIVHRDANSHRYGIPAKPSEELRMIYKVMGLNLSRTPFNIKP